MADTVSAIVGAVTNGIKWVRAQYRKFKVWLAEQLVKALDKGWKAALTIVALVTASVVMNIIWTTMKQNAIVKAVMGFIDTVKSAAWRIASMLQLDLVLATLNLAVLLNEKLYNELAPLYDELGNFAEELELDFSYITTFIEVDRAVLQASYALTGAGFLQGSAEFAQGLSTWLGRLRERMMLYAEDPQKIFLDIQAEIAGERQKTASEELSKVWAAINFAGDWVRGKGEVILTLVDEIDAQVEKMPQEIQDAIAPWWNDLTDRFDRFELDRWRPFWEHYQTFTEAVSEMFTFYGADITELKRRIEDPLDWIRSLLALPEDERATLESTIDEFLSRFLPIEESSPAAIAGEVVEVFAETELGLADYAAAVDALEVEGGGEELPEVEEIAFAAPWYESRV